MTFGKIILATVILATFFSSCKNREEVINLEQVKSPQAQKIINPGMNSIGLIAEGKIFVYYLNENKIWMLDQASQFPIPSDADGLLAMGMGTIAVLNDNSLYFYNMDSSLQWDADYELVMPLPEQYKRIQGMRMPWQRGAVAIEDNEGIVHFYYLNEKKQWQKDETATFVVPVDIDDYIMMGGMEIAIISDQKLGVYQLGLSGEWVFQDDMILALPGKYDAVLSYEPGIIAVLSGNLIQFYEADYENRHWVLDDTMNFELPQK